jgi:hypothetical protein
VELGIKEDVKQQTNYLQEVLMDRIIGDEEVLQGTKDGDCDKTCLIQVLESEGDERGLILRFDIGEENEEIYEEEVKEKIDHICK